MILSGYNKFIFSIFSENKEYLVLSVYVVRVGGKYISFLKDPLYQNKYFGETTSLLCIQYKTEYN